MSEIRKALPLPPSSTELLPLYMLQYSSFWNHKAKRYGIKTTSYAHKTTSYAHKTTSYTHKTTSYAHVKRCFECTVNGSLQMVVIIYAKHFYLSPLKLLPSYMYIAQNATKRIAVVFLTCLAQKYQISKKLQQIIQRYGPRRSDVNNNIERAIHYYETHV